MIDPAVVLGIGTVVLFLVDRIVLNYTGKSIPAGYYWGTQGLILVATMVYAIIRKIYGV